MRKPVKLLKKVSVLKELNEEQLKSVQGGGGPNDTGAPGSRA
jgi:bacteriocin-like protein